MQGSGSMLSQEDALEEGMASSCLENSIDRGSVHKVAESDTTHAGKVQGYV